LSIVSSAPNSNAGWGGAHISITPKVTTIKRRKIEITIFEQERIVLQPASAHCGVCGLHSEMLTPEQAGEMAKVEVQSIYQWLAQGKAHGMKTPNGQDRVCKNSLFPEAGVAQ